MKKRQNVQVHFVVVVVVVFSGLYQRHMEVPRLGVKSELQLPAYTMAIAVWNLNRNCNLHHSSWQQQILNSLSVLMDISRVCYR